MFIILIFIISFWGDFSKGFLGFVGERGRRRGREKMKEREREEKN